jgi:hypothetical protein
MSMPTFKIPKSVFILNTTSGGEFCMGGSELDKSIYNHRKHLHKLLIIDDIRDIPTEPMDARLRYQSIKKIKYKQPFLSKFKRATDCDYPNFLCTFEELGSDDLGVYNITTKNFPFVNKNSLIKDTEINPRTKTNDWFLEDIIHKIRSKNAIYIFAGCSTGEWENTNIKTNMYRTIDKTTDTVQTLIYNAETAFSTQISTLPLELLSPTNVPKNFGANTISRPSISTVVTMAKTLGAPLHTVVSKWGEMEKGDYEKARELLKNIKI